MSLYTDIPPPPAEYEEPLTESEYVRRVCERLAVELGPSHARQLADCMDYDAMRAEFPTDPEGAAVQQLETMEW